MQPSLARSSAAACRCGAVLSVCHMVLQHVTAQTSAHKTTAKHAHHPCCNVIPQPPLDTLASDPDLHVRELALAARQYAAASAAGAPTDHDTLYHHGLVLQELAGRLQQGSADQAAMLRQVGVWLEELVGLSCRHPFARTCAH